MTHLHSVKVPVTTYQISKCVSQIKKNIQTWFSSFTTASYDSGHKKKTAHFLLHQNHVADTAILLVLVGSSATSTDYE